MSNPDFFSKQLDYKEVPVDVGGRPGILRTAEFPGTDEPYFLQLVVPSAVKAAKGRRLVFEIHGWFASRERRWLGEHVVESVDFTRPFGHPLHPTAPIRDPPMLIQEFP